jgi:hypothetical protein
VFVAALVSVVLGAGIAPPAPDAAVPRDPDVLAERLTTTQRGLDGAVDTWRT